jgi:hypothetical protein
MTRLGTRPQAASFRPASGTAGIAACAALIVLTLLLTLPLARLPEVVPRLTVENSTVYQIDVDVTGAARDGWLDLGTLGRESTRTMEEIVDQGSQWSFRFSHAGAPAGELTVGRGALRSRGWKVTVPPEVTDRLDAAGFGASAH